MIYIDQLCTPSFPSYWVGLVKTESGLIVRSVETGLLREMNNGGSCDQCSSYLFFGFLNRDLTCHLEVTGIGKFIISASM